MDGAIFDPDGSKDVAGYPLNVYNAVNGVCFVGASQHTGWPDYNCYPEDPPQEFYGELKRRAKRSVEELLQGCRWKKG